MKEYRVAILGATGAVGREMMRVLEERQFPLSELRLLASARSAGSRLPFRGEELVLEQATPQSFAGCDIVLGAAENDVATELLPHAVAQGAVVIDNSSAYRLDPEVPLVVPEVNPQDISWHKGLISNPNCTTIITATAVAAIHRLSPIVKMTASTYQAVSGAGVGGMRELEQQVEALAKGEPVVCSTFPYQIAYNLIPQIGSFDAQGYSSEEMKLQNEGRKILHADNLLSDLHLCARAGHALALGLGLAGNRSPAFARAGPACHCQLARLPAGRRPGKQALPPCRSTPPTRTSSTSGASAATSPARRAASPCGAAATRFARAPPPTRCRLPSFSSHSSSPPVAGACFSPHRAAAARCPPVRGKCAAAAFLSLADMI